MRQLVNIRFGSQLYGTSTPASDIDLKSVYVPKARDILLQRVRPSVTNQRPKAEGEKNVAGEVDQESHSLQRYLGLLAQGQTVALDMLFAPSWSWTTQAMPEWLEIQANGHRLITKKSAAFVGYCRQQANKYGIKGSRVAAARTALKVLDNAVEQYGTTAKLAKIDDKIRAVTMDNEHMSLEKIVQIGGQTIEYWSVCGRLLQYTATIKHARDVMAKMVAEYGARSLQAEQQEGIDWKALSHAVRVGHEALELLRTGTITFPRPEAAYLLAIKQGMLPYQAVGADIEGLLEQVEAAELESCLPPEPDQEWIDAFVLRVHAQEVWETLNNS